MLMRVYRARAGWLIPKAKGESHHAPVPEGDGDRNRVDQSFGIRGLAEARPSEGKCTNSGASDAA